MCSGVIGCRSARALDTRMEPPFSCHLCRQGCSASRATANARSVPRGCLKQSIRPPRPTTAPGGSAGPRASHGVWCSWPSGTSSKPPPSVEQLCSTGKPGASTARRQSKLVQTSQVSVPNSPGAGCGNASRSFWAVTGQGVLLEPRFRTDRPGEARRARRAEPNSKAAASPSRPTPAPQQ